METWVTVQDFTKYECCASGLVRNAATLHVIKSHKNRKGYPQIQMANDLGQTKTVSLHKIICIAFHGERPTPTHHVNHIDGDKGNNNASNLEWVTPQENMDHFFDVLGGEKKTPRGYGSHKTAIFTDDQIRTIRGMGKAGVSAAKIIELLGFDCHIATITCMVSGKHYAHVVGFTEHDTPIIKNEHKRGSDHHNAIYTDDEIRLIRKLYAEGSSYHKVTAALGNKTSWVAVQCIIKRKTYAHVQD